MVAIQPCTEDKVFTLLQSHPLFKQVQQDSLQEIIQLGTMRTFRPNEAVVSQGEVINNFFIVCTGELELTTELAIDERVSLELLSAGNYYGETCLLTGEPSLITITVLKKSQLLMFDKNHFLQLITLTPLLTNKVIAALSSEIKRVNHEMIQGKNKELALAKFITESKYSLKKLVGKSTFIKSLRHKIDERARDPEPLFIAGEEGTGKILVANLIHRQGSRKHRPFIVVECEEMVEDDTAEKIFGSTSPEDGTAKFSFWELARGGTLMLNDVELLTDNAFLRLIEFLNTSREVRIILASTLKNPQEYIVQRFSGVDCRALFINALYLAPLRNRKRDIPDLIAYFLESKQKKYGRKKKAFLANDAFEKLLSHDYRQGNIKELEVIIDRALALSDQNRIDSEAIILGEINKNLPGYDLFRWQPIKKLIYSGTWPASVQFLVTCLFLLIMAGCFWAPEDIAQNLNTLVWSCFGPVIILTSIFLGRISCSICPFSFLATLSQKLFCLNKTAPFISRYYFVIIIFLYSIIFWFEETFALRTSPFLTGILFLSITSVAVLTAVLFKGEVWCKYMCPLGAVISVCSTLSPIELRANTEVCQNKCQTYNCYKGGRLAGCPLTQHVMYIDNSINCKLCFNCFLNCPHNSVKLSLRPPAREIWTFTNVHWGMAPVVAAFGFMLIPFNTLNIIQKHFPANWHLVFNLSYWLVFMIIVSVSLGLQAKLPPTKKLVPYVRLLFSFVPLISGGHLAYQLNHNTSLHLYQLTKVTSIGQSIFITDLSGLLQLLVLTSGLLFSLICLAKVYKYSKIRVPRGLVYLTAAVFYGVMITLLFCSI
ncbi:cyclic nucleotide-binding domain-containing protein [Desulforamulus aeronauticus]|uniref:Response regulator containing CheY-like receiver, AAA-type ATPase, and DNA-binding domains n=1 Tax=Desulforamulus aeronauticus DSM 10349 TaxID=1121421 RepID=A0A1M6RKV4_9FIRM|nr:cyclic nucleotide-binding domain-containing protein [Desulforamulus aeronauticus]SHK33085.1 Response regulator containing CheY-like receiver, AAA-type ATPase, and DNA-binding domains [Desulforamulus aeronauticus DSM 10349]